MVSKFSRNKDEIKSLKQELQASPTLYKFIVYLLETKFTENLFSDGYGEERAKADGKALLAAELLKIVHGVYNDRESDKDDSRKPRT